MSSYGKWEILKPLGEGGQGKVYISLDSSKLNLQTVKQRIADGRLPHVGATQAEILESAGQLAEAILEYGSLDSPGNLGALKVLHPVSDGKNARKQIERMRSEIEALRSVSHPNLIRILDDDIENRWFVMEYFQGGTLADHLGTFKGDFVLALKNFRPLVEAVAELHRSSFVHRDTKPENIFVSKRGLVVGDLGLVYFQDQKSGRATDTFENVGSRDWMPGWAMGSRIEEVRPSFDVFSLGKILWSMISGQPKLQLWYHHKDRFEVEKMFPGNPDIRWARLILDRCIVENEDNCLSNASDLLSIIDRILRAVDRHAQILGNKVPRICRVCGIGEYSEMSRDTLMLAQTFRMFLCRNCGHTELFFAGPGTSYPAWTFGEQLQEVRKKEETATLHPDLIRVRERLQAVDLSVQIVSGHADNFLLNLTNHSDEEILLTRIRLETGGVEISGPAEPPNGTIWNIAKRGAKPIGWRASPDPVASLIKLNLHAGVDFTSQVDVMLRVELEGVTRQITKRIVVRVNANNHAIWHLVG